MLSESILRRALRGAGVEAPVRYDEVTDSTNATALRLAEEGAPEWTLVAAGHQTEGRGRLGRRWVSEPGRSLLFSVVLRPRIDAERAGLLTLLAGASMAHACRLAAGVEVGCKWPNDLLLEGGKVGGILAEARVEGSEIRHVVVGIGVNLAHPPREVEDAAGLGGVDPGALLTEFLREFRSAYALPTEEFAQSVLAAWREVGTTLGRQVRATTAEGRVVVGRASGVDEHGNLAVETPEGRRIVAFGEVAHLAG